MRVNGSVFIVALAALASATPMSENKVRDDEASCTCGSDMLQRSFEKCVYYNVESSPSCQASEVCVYEQTISCAEKNGCECPDLTPPASTGTPTPTPSPTPIPTTLQIVTITAIPSSSP
ncbi:unnamed protein product [Clonostachys rosea]|uniref:Extracellular membrane protein CFEM domain-containing protein n=1 Tax=Bionectria ochroleuca TaxID=29856 RepID=A0ABY6UY38_BIOOC|nr:unnamed protein product [Clonostachys rosea]